MCRYLYITTLVLLTPFLAFFSPLPLLIGEPARLAYVERFPLILYLFNHLAVFLDQESGQFIIEKSKEVYEDKGNYGSFEHAGDYPANTG